MKIYAICASPRKGWNCDQLLEQFNVLGVDDRGNALADVEKLLGGLAGDIVVDVVFRQGDEQVGVLDAGIKEIALLGRLAVQNGDAVLGTEVTADTVV